MLLLFLIRKPTDNETNFFQLQTKKIKKNFAHSRIKTELKKKQLWWGGGRGGGRLYRLQGRRWNAGADCVFSSRCRRRSWRGQERTASGCGRGGPPPGDTSATAFPTLAFNFTSFMTYSWIASTQCCYCYMIKKKGESPRWSRPERSPKHKENLGLTEPLKFLWAK